MLTLPAAFALAALISLAGAGHFALATASR